MINRFFHTPMMFEGRPGYEVLQVCDGRMKVKQWLPKCPAVVGILSRKNSTEVTAERFYKIVEDSNEKQNVLGKKIR